MGLRCEKWREQALVVALVFLAFALVQCIDVDGEGKGGSVEPESATRNVVPQLPPKWIRDSGSGQGSSPDGSWQYGWGWGWGTGSHRKGPGFGFGYGGSGGNNGGGSGGGGGGGSGSGGWRKRDLFRDEKTTELNDGGGNN